MAIFTVFMFWFIILLNDSTSVPTSIVFMSTNVCALTRGCCTLTATTVPSFRVARCTWANDAAPRGSGSNSTNSSSTCQSTVTNQQNVACQSRSAHQSSVTYQSSLIILVKPHIVTYISYCHYCFTMFTKSSHFQSNQTKH